MKEKDFLKKYKQDDYKRPSLAADMTVFSVIDSKEDDYRKLPEKLFSILLIKRAEHPFKDMWALPGGFVREGESVEDTAKRELKEETGIGNADLKQLNIFSEPERDPRGWIFSCAFMALTENSNTPLAATKDAKEAKWFSLKYKQLKEKSSHSQNGYKKISQYELLLSADNIELSAVIEVEENSSLYNKETKYRIIKNSGLAFDHAKIIAFAVSTLRSGLEESVIAFRFLPQLFTLTALQQVYETILDKKLLTPNFRRKIASYVTETKESTSNAGHRPAKLYKRNLEAFLKL